jgi:hypothetical protein
MDLLDSYIRTLHIFLPRDQRDDIIRELTEEIRAQVADKEAELGRPLTTDEQTAVIGQYGHPMLMAARYRPQQHLVGPLIFPYYWLVLRVVIGLVVLGHAIAAAVLAAGGASWVEIGQAGEQLVRTVLVVGGWFTLLAAVIDRSLVRSRLLETWDPRRMLSSTGTGNAVRQAERAIRHLDQIVGRQRSPAWPGRDTRPGQSSPLASFLVGAVLSSWWLLSLKFPVLLLGGGAAILDWAPVVHRLFPVLVIAQIVMLAERFVGVKGLAHRGLLRLVSILWAVGFPLYFLLMTDRQWVVWRGAPDTHAQFDALFVIAGRTLSLVEFVNGIFSIVLIVIACAGVVRGASWLWRRLASGGSGAARGAAPAMFL